MAWNTYPMLFTGPMVRALQDRRKTQTLRPCDPQPCHVDDSDMPWMVRIRKCRHVAPTPASFVLAYNRYLEDDRIWVRETTAVVTLEHSRKGFPYVLYRADGLAEPPSGRWTPSIHMRREHCRLELQVTRDARILRLSDLTTSDMCAEGLQSRPAARGDREEWEVAEGVWKKHVNIREAFSDAWDRMYGHISGLGWSDDPWVHQVPLRVVRWGNRMARDARQRKVHREAA